MFLYGSSVFQLFSLPNFLSSSLPGNLLSFTPTQRPTNQQGALTGMLPVQSYRTPCLGEPPTGLMLCCSCLESLNHNLTRCLHVYFALSPENHEAHLAPNDNEDIRYSHLPHTLGLSYPVFPSPNDLPHSSVKLRCIPGIFMSSLIWWFTAT